MPTGPIERLARAICAITDDGKPVKVVELARACGVDGLLGRRAAQGIAINVDAYLKLCAAAGIDPASALKALTAHLESNTPWHARLTVESEAAGAPFRSGTGGPARRAMEAAFAAAYGTEATTQGQGGSIPLCNVFAQTYPEAEIMLNGVEEPGCLIHAPNESVDPSEIEHIALTEALFLAAYGS